mmetsp:Transcript_11373/g.27423  ORF Transcript_11373/g.27423 Transcript_11373/m.27423 type:complete len:226 (-) Transcript_11373:146-823(-)
MEAQEETLEEEDEFARSGSGIGSVSGRGRVGALRSARTAVEIIQGGVSQALASILVDYIQNEMSDRAIRRIRQQSLQKHLQVIEDAELKRRQAIEDSQIEELEGEEFARSGSGIGSVSGRGRVGALRSARTAVEIIQGGVSQALASILVDYIQNEFLDRAIRRIRQESAQLGQQAIQGEALGDIQQADIQQVQEHEERQGKIFQDMITQPGGQQAVYELLEQGHG